jgi:hypothetical protein
MFEVGDFFGAYSAIYRTVTHAAVLNTGLGLSLSRRRPKYSKKDLESCIGSHSLNQVDQDHCCELGSTIETETL